MDKITTPLCIKTYFGVVDFYTSLCYYILVKIFSLGGQSVSNSNNKNGDYIVIHKETVVNYFFMSVLGISFALFIVMLLSSGYKMLSNKQGIDYNLIASYKDDYLNVHYPIPGGDWVMAEVDTTEISETINASMGEDEYFSIDDDKLTEEVLSLICFTETGSESEEAGYRQFMSFTFMPNEGYKDESLLKFATAYFEESMKNSGDYKSQTLTSSSLDEFGGVMLKMEVVQEVESEKADGTVEKTDMKTYYTQYVQVVGENIATATYGCLTEDNSVDIYMQYFLNNIVTEKSLTMSSSDLSE
jgi:hypothetical protein